MKINVLGLIVLLLASFSVIQAEEEYYFKTDKANVVESNKHSFETVRGKKKVKVDRSSTEIIYVIIAKGFPAHIYLPDYLLTSKIRNEVGKEYLNIYGKEFTRNVQISAGIKAEIGQRFNFVVRCRNGYEVIVDVLVGSINDANETIKVIDRDLLDSEPTYNRDYFYRMKDQFMKEKMTIERTMQDQLFSSIKKLQFHDQHFIKNSSFFLESVAMIGQDLYINFSVPGELKNIFNKDSIKMRFKPYHSINLNESTNKTVHKRPDMILKYEHDDADRISLIIKDLSSIGNTFDLDLDIDDVVINKQINLNSQNSEQMDLFFDPITQY